MSESPGLRLPAGPALWASRHPLAAWTLLLVLAALGVAAAFRVPLLPPKLLTAPLVTVVVEDPGVPAPLLTAAITQPLEQALSGVAGLERLSAHERDGRVQLDLWFRSSAWRERARDDLSARLARVAPALPATASAPRVESEDRAAAAEVVISGNAYEPAALRRWVETAFAHQLTELPAVRGLRIDGGATHAILVQPDLRRLTALGLALEDLVAAVRGATDHLTVAESAGAAAVAALPLTLPGGDNLALSEVARVRAVPVAAGEQVQHDGVGAVRVTVFKQDAASHIETADAVRARIAWLRANRQIPRELRVEMPSDPAGVLKRAARRALTLETLTLLAALVAGGLAFRFRRPALLLAAVLPGGALIAVAVLAARGGGFDSVTLGGLLLALVPALLPALVMYLRITRAAGGETREQAVAAGQRDVLRVGALWAAALLPLWGVSGAAGVVLGELVWTLSVVLGVALAGGLLLVPAALAPWPRFASMRRRRGPVERAARLFDALLRASLARPWLALAAALAPWALTVATAPPVLARAELLAPFARDELIADVPDLDAGEGLGALATQLAARLRAVEGVGSVIGAYSVDTTTGRGELRLRITPASRSARGDRVLRDHIGSEGSGGLPDGAYPFVPAVFPGQGAEAVGDPWRRALQGEVALRITGPDRERLASHAQRLIATLTTEPGLAGVRYRGGTPWVDIGLVLDPERSAAQAVDAARAARALHIARHGLELAVLLEGDRRIAVRLTLAARDRAALDRLPLHGETAQRPAVFLRDVGRLEPRMRAAEHLREEGQPAIELVAMPSGHRSLAELVETLRRAAGALDLRPGERWSLGGAAAMLVEAGRQLAWIIGIVLLFMLLVLSGEFRSWRQPLAILIAPAWALAAFLATLSAPGFVVSLWVWPALLVALAVTAGFGAGAVIAVDTRHARGQAWPRAIGQGARAQLRPALLIAAVAVISLAPLALGLARGFEWLAPAAAALLSAVLAGLIAATVAVPLSYYFLGVPRQRGNRPQRRQE
ncbi:MAG TPA: efflux RND transporter permease subunit [Acidiferrobacterales bacterium]